MGLLELTALPAALNVTVKPHKSLDMGQDSVRVKWGGVTAPRRSPNTDPALPEVHYAPNPPVELYLRAGGKVSGTVAETGKVEWFAGRCTTGVFE